MTGPTFSGKSRRTCRATGWHSVESCEESGQRDAHNENSERDKYERIEPVSAVTNLVDIALHMLSGKHIGV